LEREVPTDAFAFNLVQKLNALNVVLKRSNTMGFAQSGEIALSVMAERGVSYIMSQ
jgi:hypothetical protein